jgi:hypothetical protein
MFMNKLPLSKRVQILSHALRGIVHQSRVGAALPGAQPVEVGPTVVAQADRLAIKDDALDRELAEPL